MKLMLSAYFDGKPHWFLAGYKMQLDLFQPYFLSFCDCKHASFFFFTGKLPLTR